MPETQAAPQPAPGSPAVPSPAPIAPPLPTTPPAPEAPRPAEAPRPGEAPKPAEPAPPAKPDQAAAPLLGEDWKPRIPEGRKLDDGLFGGFKAIMADPKLSPADRAQALVDLQFKANADTERALTEQMQRDRVAGLEKLKGDPEFGGGRFDQTRREARSILDNSKHGPAVSKKLEAYGLDCDPDFVKFLAEIRSQIAEDSTSTRLVTPSPVVRATPKSLVERQAATYQNGRK